MKKNKVNDLPKLITRSVNKDIEELIWFAVTHWDMNPMTKRFAKELTKEIANYLRTLK